VKKEEERLNKVGGKRSPHSLYKHCIKENDRCKERESTKKIRKKKKKKYGNTDVAKKEEERLTKGSGQRSPHSLYKHCKKENDGWKDRESYKEGKKRNMEIQTRRKRKKRD